MVLLISFSAKNPPPCPYFLNFDNFERKIIKIPLHKVRRLCRMGTMAVYETVVFRVGDSKDLLNPAAANPKTSATI
jgi:hypothetical protein